MSTSIPSESSGRSGLPAGTMSPVHMLMVIVGVLLAVAAPAVLANSGPVLVGLSLLAAGLALIIVGAAGLGRAIQPQSPIREDETDPAAYPTRLVGQLDPALSRWMWLLKWLLAIPHYVVLSILWIAFLVVTVAAGLVILFTGRYPASLFQFTVGVLRWNWRVSFYAYGVLGTDQYPPFTLARTDYPAEFDVAYPARLSHWKVLVKSWLLALPQLLIVAALTGGVWASTDGTSTGSANGISLLGILVLVTAVILLFTGVYRLGLFNLLMGINRWIYRTITYTALMRDDYPPFRLDQGPLEPPANRRDAGNASL